MRPLVGTSLKMHLTTSETDDWLARARPQLARVEGLDMFVLPSFPSLAAARARLAGSNVAWGAQDLSVAEDGAHTGDVSARMLVDLGCSYVAIGHAERRRDHGESDSLIAAKAARAVAAGLTPVVCVGEPSDDGVAAALAVARAQVKAAFAEVSDPAATPPVVAYEPVWAIGAGARPASPSHVAAVHNGIHELLATIPVANGARVIYGGSVDAESVEPLISAGRVDGLFVGRAALDPLAFVAIASAVAELNR